MNKRTLGIVFTVFPLIALVVWALILSGYSISHALGSDHVFLLTPRVGLGGLGILIGLLAIVLPVIGVVLMVKYSKSFSQTGAVSKGWQVMKNNAGLVFGSELILIAYELIYLFVVSHLHNPGLVMLVALLSIFIQSFLGIGLFKIYFALLRGHTATINTMFSGAPLLLNVLAGAFLYCLIVIGGFILFVVPGLIWAYKYSMFGFLIIDKGLGPVEALKASAKLTDGAKWDLFAFRIFAQALICLGMLCLGVGVLVALPMVLIASADAYLQLAKK